jgi:hypothetical protein
MFKYGDYVEIQVGFYQGIKGHVLRCSGGDKYLVVLDKYRFEPEANPQFYFLEECLELIVPLPKGC